MSANARNYVYIKLVFYVHGHYCIW